MTLQLNNIKCNYNHFFFIIIYFKYIYLALGTEKEMKNTYKIQSGASFFLHY